MRLAIRIFQLPEIKSQKPRGSNPFPEDHWDNDIQVRRTNHNGVIKGVDEPRCGFKRLLLVLEEKNVGGSYSFNLTGPTFLNNE